MRMSHLGVAIGTLNHSNTPYLPTYLPSSSIGLMCRSRPLVVELHGWLRPQYWDSSVLDSNMNTAIEPREIQPPNPLDPLAVALTRHQSLERGPAAPKG